MGGLHDQNPLDIDIDIDVGKCDHDPVEFSGGPGLGRGSPIRGQCGASP